jgi:hypothetical protein
MARISPTTNLSYLGGIPPKQRDYNTGISKALGDDVAVVIERANVTPAPTGAAWSYVVPFHLETAAGETVPFNGTIAAAAVSTVGDQTPTVSDATPAVVNGRGTVTLIGAIDTWANNDKTTLTLTYTDLQGVSKTDTFTVTFTAV